MAGNIDLEIDVNGVKATKKALKKGLRKGLEDAGNTLLDEGEDAAEDAVMHNGDRGVWHGKVKRGFETEENQFSRWYHWQGHIRNPVPHAKVVDVGLAPRGEITGSNPSVQDIMPWVVDNLGPTDYGGGGGSPPFSPGSSGGGDSPGGIDDPDRTVSNYSDPEELGILEASITSDFAYSAVLGDGTNVLFKSHEEDNPDNIRRGTVANEIVWSDAQERLGWNLGPKSREDTHTPDGSTEEVTGTIQEYVDGYQGDNEIYSGYGPPGDRTPRHNFVQQNREWMAKTAAIDYIVGNEDRHFNNIRVTDDGEPRAIDNGGNVFTEGLDPDHIQFTQKLFRYDTAIDEDQLHQQNLEFLDKTENIIGQLAQDQGFRQGLIEKVAEVHGKDSDYYGRIVTALGEDIGEGHILYEDDTGVPAYKRDVEYIRDRFRKAADGDSPEYLYVDSDYESDGDDDTDPLEDNPEKIDELNEMLDDALGDI